MVSTYSKGNSAIYKANSTKGDEVQANMIVTKAMLNLGYGKTVEGNSQIKHYKVKPTSNFLPKAFIVKNDSSEYSVKVE